MPHRLSWTGQRTSAFFGGWRGVQAGWFLNFEILGETYFFHGFRAPPALPGPGAKGPQIFGPPGPRAFGPAAKGLRRARASGFEGPGFKARGRPPRAKGPPRQEGRTINEKCFLLYWNRWFCAPLHFYTRSARKAQEARPQDLSVPTMKNAIFEYIENDGFRHPCPQ